MALINELPLFYNKSTVIIATYFDAPPIKPVIGTKVQLTIQDYYGYKEYWNDDGISAWVNEETTYGYIGKYLFTINDDKIATIVHIME